MKKKNMKKNCEAMKMKKCKKCVKFVSFVLIGVVWMVVVSMSVVTPVSANPLEEALFDYRLGYYEDAFEKFVQLAKQGDSEAQFRLGVMLNRGLGAPQNFVKAAAWYRKAANAGHPGAQNNLGLIYRDGRGVAKNNLMAYMWLSLSASQFTPKARKNRDDLAQEMRSEEIVQAQQLAAEFIANLWSEQVEKKRTESEKGEKGEKPAGKFVVQLGLFTVPENVEALRQKLLDLEIRPHVEQVSVRGRNYQRVRVGPFADAVSAKKMMQRMNDLFKIRSAVLPVGF